MRYELVLGAVRFVPEIGPLCVCVPSCSFLCILVYVFLSSHRPFLSSTWTPCAMGPSGTSANYPTWIHGYYIPKIGRLPG
jgi:hypothetical protein